MRLLHPRTLEIAAERDDIPKTVISHVWAEIYKWHASGQKHPKVFITDIYDIGCYMRHVYKCGIKKRCNLDKNKIKNLGDRASRGFTNKSKFYEVYFDDNYLFSDATSLYLKGINIFPDIFGDQWKKYAPIISLKEIQRVVGKTIERKKNGRSKKTRNV